MKARQAHADILARRQGTTHSKPSGPHILLDERALAAHHLDYWSISLARL
jgi:hypothetical protein